MIHTSYDHMNESLVEGCTPYGRYDMPILKKVNIRVDETVDFGESLSRKLKGHKQKNVNFYIDDFKFSSVWNSPDKYLEHLSCFQSVCMPDFSIALGKTGMPFALNIYNKYRNHALAYYWQMNGIRVIPSLSVGDRDSRDWIYDGLPMRSTLAVCSNGRVWKKDARLEFCEELCYAVDKLEPIRLIFYGRIPDELNLETLEIQNLPVRNQTI